MKCRKMVSFFMILMKKSIKHISFPYRYIHVHKKMNLLKAYIFWGLALGTNNSPNDLLKALISNVTCHMYFRIHLKTDRKGW